jgi:amino acid adenylation domain-containing protein
VEELQVERHLGITPLFQVMFMLQNVPRSESKLGGLTFSSLKISPEVERFEFTLTAADEGGRIRCELNYRRALFAEGTIRRLLRHWENLLTEIVRDPQIPVGELPILSKAERQQLLIEWNRTRAEYSIKCVHELFEQQASRMPESVALVFDGQEMTYGELNRRAGRLAGYLKTLGAGPEVLVGICIERSLEMLVGLLGILKSGAAYLPLDPAYPIERLRYLAEDSRIGIAVTQQHLLDVIPEIIITRVCLDSPWEGEGQPLENSVNTSGGVDNLAYVIYTSGSTGRPKGVGVSHRNVANFFKGMDDAVHCCTEDILLAVTNITFDISIVELFWALIRGVKVVIAPDPLAVHSRPRENSEANEATYGGKLPGELADVYRPTIMQCTPSTMNILLAGNEGFASFSSLGTLMLGGEKLPASLARVIKESSLPCKLLNMYGPTETTIWSSTSEVSEAESVISIGKPIVNTEFYVLDDLHLQPVPIGIIGELCIGGHGVARGYIDRADLTAEKFIPDPFADRPGSRLYRTGDLARYLPDGKVELLGRKDNQVKIRGHRIELGEIEAVLGQCPGVQACVVTVHEDDSTEKRIVAYVVRNGFGVAQSGELKDYLRERLPGYMAPAAIVEVEKLPLTQNGKVDLRALPKPQKTGMEIDLLPWNDVELQLAFVWEELLELSNIGRKQTFFDLGGHSLLAIRLVRRIKEKFGKDLPVSAIFEHPTIEELAKRLRQDYQPVRRRNLVALYRGGSKPPLFFVHPAGGDAQGYRHLARALGDDQPFYAFQPLDEEEIKKDTVISVEERAAQYLAELREFQRSGPYLIGGWSFGAYVAFEIAQQLWRQNQVVERLFLLDITTQPAPQVLQQQHRFQDEADELLDMAMVDAPQVAFSFQPVEGQGPEERLSNVVHQLVKAGIVPAEIEMSQVKTWLEARKRRIQSLLSYNFLPYPGTVTLLRSTEGIVPLEGTDIAPDDPTLGFAKLSPEVQVHYVSGTTHNNMVRQPHTEKVAALLKKCLPDVKSLSPPAA